MMTKKGWCELVKIQNYDNNLSGKETKIQYNKLSDTSINLLSKSYCMEPFNHSHNILSLFAMEQ